MVFHPTLTFEKRDRSGAQKTTRSGWMSEGRSPQRKEK